MLSTTTFLLSKTFLLSQFSPPSAAHNIADTHLPLCDPTWLPFIKIFPPSAAHAFNYIPFIKNIPFITIFPPLCSPCFQLQHSFYQKHSFYQNFPPLCSPCFQLHSFNQKHSFYHNFPPPSAAHAFNYNIPFIKNITFITISPPSAAHNIADTHLPLCDPTWLPFIKIFPPLCSPCFLTTFLLSKTFLLSQFSPPLCSPQHSRHTFAFVRPYLTSFYQNFSPPLQPMLSTTTFLLSKTFLLSQFSPPLCSPQHSRHTFAFVRPYLTSFYQNFTPPSATHAFNYNIPFIKNIPFITIFPPLCSPQHCRHTFAFVRPYLTSFYQNFPPPLQPMLSTTTFLLSNTFILSKFSPPSAAHAFNYNIPFIKNIPFITIFPPPSAAHNIADIHLPLCDPTWLPFIKIFPPPLQPMLSTTTFLLTKTFLLSQFSPPLQPMLSTTFLLSKFSPPLCSPCFQWFRLLRVFSQLFDPCTTPNRGRVTQHTIQTTLPWIKKWHSTTQKSLFSG